MAPLKANPLLIKASVSTLHFLQGPLLFSWQQITIHAI